MGDITVITSNIQTDTTTSDNQSVQIQAESGYSKTIFACIQRDGVDSVSPVVTYNGHNMTELIKVVDNNAKQFLFSITDSDTRIITDTPINVSATYDSANSNRLTVFQINGLYKYADDGITYSNSSTGTTLNNTAKSNDSIILNICNNTQQQPSINFNSGQTIILSSNSFAMYDAIAYVIVSHGSYDQSASWLSASPWSYALITIPCARNNSNLKSNS
jgi:hypothetical protein